MDTTENIRISASIMASNCLDNAGMSGEYRSDYMAILSRLIEENWSEAVHEDIDEIFNAFLNSDELAQLERQIQEDEAWDAYLDDDLDEIVDVPHPNPGRSWAPLNFDDAFEDMLADRYPEGDSGLTYLEVYPDPSDDGYYKIKPLRADLSEI